MLSLRQVRRFCHSGVSRASVPPTYCHAATSSHNQMSEQLGVPALIKLKSERNPDKLFNLFNSNAHNRLVIENRFAFEDTVVRLAGACRFDHIETLLEHQKALPQGRREGFVVRIIMLYGKAGMIKHALATFHDMHLYGCERTVKSFNAALKVLTKTSDVEAIQEFLQEAPEKYNIELDIWSVNIVIKAFCDVGFLDKAYLVMVEMERLGIPPDVVTYTTLMSAFYKHDRWLIGNGMWNLMVLKACAPNLAAFNVRIQFLVNRRQAWEANDLLKLMQRHGLMPDLVTYNLVIKGFYVAGYPEMAKRVYTALHGRGQKPSVKIYQTMIHYLCKGREFDLAYKMSKDCMRKNMFPNMDTTRSLLEGLVKNGKIEKAKLIMTLVLNRMPPYHSKQLDSLQNIVSTSQRRIDCL